MSVFLWIFRDKRSSLRSISYTLHLSARQIAVTQGEKQEVNVGVTSGPVSAHFPCRLGQLVDFYFLLLEFGATSSWYRGEDLEDGLQRAGHR